MSCIWAEELVPVVSNPVSGLNAAKPKLIERCQVSGDKTVRVQQRSRRRETIAKVKRTEERVSSPEDNAERREHLSERRRGF